MSLAYRQQTLYTINSDYIEVSTLNMKKSAFEGEAGVSDNLREEGKLIPSV